MIKRFYTWSICFLGFLSIFSIYLGYLGLISAVPSLLVILISIVLSWWFTKEVEEEGIESIRILFFILLLFFLIIVLIILPNFVFPHGAGDFQNHARNVRIFAKSHSSDSGGLGHMTYYTFGAIIYSLYPHTYVVNTFIAIVLSLFSILGIFLISQEIFDEKIAFYSTFIFAFSITNLWMLEQGFFPQLLGQLFFIASVYFFISKRSLPLLLSNAVLISYPHYFSIYIIFLIFESVRTKEWRNFFIPLLSCLILIPEVYNYSRLFLININKYHIFRGTLLLRGGIITPTLGSLLIFSFCVMGLYIVFQKHKSILLDLFYSIFILISIIIIGFIFAVISGYSKDIRFLYMAAKLFYLLVVPLSIISAVGVDYTVKKYKSVAILLLFFHFIYFSVYAGVILPKKANFPGEAYEIFEKMDTLPGEFKVGVDSNLINNKGWMPVFPYKSLVDVPDTGYLTGAIPRIELARALQFYWANYTFHPEISGALMVINSKGEEVVKFGETDVDYYITRQNLDRPIVFKERMIKVYRLT